MFFLYETFVYFLFQSLNPFIHFKFAYIFLVLYFQFFSVVDLWYMNLFFSFGVSRCLVLKNIFSCFQCPLLNISYCPATEVDLSLGKKLVRWISSDFLFFFVNLLKKWSISYSVNILYFNY